MTGTQGPDCAYQEAACEPWTGVEQEDGGDVLVLTGTCTRCTHWTSYTSSLVYKVGSAPGSAPAAQEHPPILIRCDCAGSHSGTGAANTQGCGGMWSYPEPGQR